LSLVPKFGGAKKTREISRIPDNAKFTDSTPIDTVILGED